MTFGSTDHENFQLRASIWDISPMEPIYGHLWSNGQIFVTIAMCRSWASLSKLADPENSSVMQESGTYLPCHSSTLHP